jgi:hypothetical protein
LALDWLVSSVFRVQAKKREREIETETERGDSEEEHRERERQRERRPRLGDVLVVHGVVEDARVVPDLLDDRHPLVHEHAVAAAAGAAARPARCG